MPKKYVAADIQLLTGLEPVRARPGMYTNTENPNHLVQEVVDNSADEALNGHASKIEIILHQDNSLTVIDDGRGIPCDIHPEQGIPAVEMVLTSLHAGGKFSHDNYQFAGGLHGVGISVVNALSESVEIEVRRDGIIYAISFKDGKTSSELKQIGTTKLKDTGTKLRFKPDTSFFDEKYFVVSELVSVLRSKALLCPGLTVEFYDENTNDKHSWYYPEGMQNYFVQVLDAAQSIGLLGEPFSCHATSDQGELDFVVQWCQGGRILSESYVNLVPTVAGGTHVSAFKSGLFEAVKEFCELHKLSFKNKINADDIIKNASFILSVRVQETKFSGQTKDKFSARDEIKFIPGIVKDQFGLWMNSYTQQAEELVNLFAANADKRIRSARMTDRKQIIGKSTLPGKLADCISKETKKTELFLVEGDSAGGSAKQARDRKFQAILPLRGKILNTWEMDSGDILSSVEIQNIATAIGVEPGSADIENLRYGKICILADADSDGLHIATLLCAVFVRHFYTLVEEGVIYIAQPPLYRIDHKKQAFYAIDDREKDDIVQKIGSEKVNVQRFKGLGEMNPEQLRETVMLVKSRKLKRLIVEDLPILISMMDMLLNKKRSSDRRAWLEDHGKLANIS